MDRLHSLKGWFLGLSDSYGVNPFVFGAIYVGAIPFFTLSIGWHVSNLKKVFQLCGRYLRMLSFSYQSIYI